ncbi:GNAT family N-acetyltransferase [Thalassotalea sp. M1531]|uniref:GNAT family N-acetyltransferase n=1 Tax=Thalassotalea algicola TaxID=2716224 RepID=A0A7Y0LHW3_9GAMM|nr:YiiD C-terminal domain-containing protein [Thalassotalea algicola]NMP33550.1 GNAT family N-acetyltransferase [Thalassotalea algicola]
MYQVKAPENKADFKRYYQFRWQWLRAPWQQPIGSEIDDLENQAIHRFIENEQGQIIAVGRLHKTSQNQAQIRYMAVDEQYQGQGLGKLVIQSLEQEAVKHGVTQITLNAREVALVFYQRLGYQLAEKSHVLYGEIQHFLMTKSLNTLDDNKTLLSQALTCTWHNTIPMSAAMNMKVNYFNGEQLFTSSDLAFNKNLHNTMFAGSIYTQATLTGWGWVYFLLAENKLEGDIVLANAEIKYLAPVAGAGVGFTNVALTEGDITTLSQKGKARIRVEVHILSGDKVAAKFIGQYAVIAAKD